MRERERERQRDRKTDRQADRDRQTETGRASVCVGGEGYGVGWYCKPL